MGKIGWSRLDDKISEGSFCTSDIRIDFSFGRERRSAEGVLEIFVMILSRVKGCFNPGLEL